MFGALADEPPHDILAAEEFPLGAADPLLQRRARVVLPPDPSGIDVPHDVLAAEEFAIPAPYGRTPLVPAVSPAPSPPAGRSAPSPPAVRSAPSPPAVRSAPSPPTVRPAPSLSIPAESLRLPRRLARLPGLAGAAVLIALVLRRGPRLDLRRRRGLRDDGP